MTCPHCGATKLTEHPCPKCGRHPATCTTHHHACECREAEFARVEAERDRILKVANDQAEYDAKENLRLVAERDRLRGAIERYRDLRRTSPEPPWVLERELFAALPNRQPGRSPTDNPDAHPPERAGDTRPDARVSKTTGSDHPSRKTCVQSVIQIDPNSSKGLDDKASAMPETSDSEAGTSDYRTESRAPSGQSVEQGSGVSEGEDRRVASGGGSPHLPGSPLAGPVPPVCPSCGSDDPTICCCGCGPEGEEMWPHKHVGEDSCPDPWHTSSPTQGGGP